MNVDNPIEKIEQILTKTGWSQTRFSQELGVTFATVNRWIRGHTKPHLSQLRQIERLFKTVVGIRPLPAEQIRDIISKVETIKQKFPDIKKILQVKEIMEEFLLELTYNSDAIEGSTLTKKETEAIIFDNTSVENISLVEHLEAVNHTVVLKDIFTGRFIPPINEERIKQIHRVLMQGIRDDAGQYSKHQRAIRGVDLILPHPDNIVEEMALFCNKVNFFRGHAIEHIARMHADFEAIHPFGDGNGRVGRLIMIIQLINKGFAPSIIPINEKERYYESLEYAQKKSESHFVYFINECILKGYRIIEKYISF